MLFRSTVRWGRQSSNLLAFKFKFLEPRIADEIRQHRGAIAKGLGCAAGSAVLLGLVTWLIKETLNAVEQGNADMLVRVSAGVVALFAVRYFLTRGQMWYLGSVANRLSANLRVKIFRKLQRLPISYYNEKRSGSIQSVLTNDVTVFQTAVTAMRDMVEGPIKVVVGFVAIVVMNWQLALVSIGVMPVMLLFIQHNARRMKQAQAQVQTELGDLTATSQEQIEGVRIVKAFGAEEQARGRFDERVQRTLRSQLIAVGRFASLKPMVELIGAVALAVTLFVCASLVRQGALSVGELGGFIYALDIINQGFKNVGSLNNTLAQVEAATDRIYKEVLDVPEASQEVGGSLKPEGVEGRIEFRNVSFTYPDGTEAIRDVSFVIEPGSSLAMVGPSGAGKSTISDLLLRFYEPTSGEILLDGIDIKEIDLQFYRGLIGVVPQQTFLFAGTISDNLRLGAPEASDEQVLQAARAAHADAFIDRSPEGYGTVLGERGVKLSGGEGQRISIARALIRDPKILILDEATSNLDSISERAVSKALEEVMRSRTSLFIAHRLTTAARADKVLVLRSGEVIELGSHSELLAASGPYASMYQAYTEGVLDSVET